MPWLLLLRILARGFGRAGTSPCAAELGRGAELRAEGDVYPPPAYICDLQLGTAVRFPACLTGDDGILQDAGVFCRFTV